MAAFVAKQMLGSKMSAVKGKQCQCAMLLIDGKRETNAGGQLRKTGGIDSAAPAEHGHASEKGRTQPRLLSPSRKGDAATGPEFH